ncbi:MAG: DUF4290 domain-containing protein [Capnocytophaga sp.]|nr:DUF4290 domain-containing protein [Capnocytophaga sp.]
MNYNLEYNTERQPLIIPEYGRHIQKMVERAVTIEDPVERNNTARGIIAVMGNLNPHLRDVPDFQHKLWDQLFIMSGFLLDVDSPYEKPTPEQLSKRPERLAYPQSHPKYRFYGNIIKNMIDTCLGWEEGELKTALKYSIANHMKKSYLSWNKDTVEDNVIFQHLYEMSNGQINLAKAEEDLSHSKNLAIRNTNSKTTGATPKKFFKKNTNNWKKNNNRKKNQ